MLLVTCFLLCTTFVSASSKNQTSLLTEQLKAHNIIPENKIIDEPKLNLIYYPAHTVSAFGSGKLFQKTFIERGPIHSDEIQNRYSPNIIGPKMVAFITPDHSGSDVKNPDCVVENSGDETELMFEMDD